MNLFEFQLLKHSATGQSFLWDSLDFQTTLHNLAGGFLVLIEGVGVDIQRGRRLAVLPGILSCSHLWQNWRAEKYPYRSLCFVQPPVSFPASLWIRTQI